MDPIQENNGFVAFQTNTSEPSKTLVVLGCARGGTSACAGALHHLGVFTGRGSRPPIFEDTWLANAIESGNKKKTTEIIEAYNQEHQVWAFKRPSLPNFIDSVHPMLRAPLYLCVFRDLAAIAARNATTEPSSDLSTTIANAMASYSRILDFLNKNKPNAILISYEKLLQRREDFIADLLAASKLQNISNEARDSAIRSISASPHYYLNTISASDQIGHLDECSRHAISGWAVDKAGTAPAILTIKIDGRPLTEIRADQYRSDLKYSGIHPSGLCGFRWTVPVDFDAASEALVSVAFKDSQKQLQNSPAQLQNNNG